jgi:hypothetical protein
VTHAVYSEQFLNVDRQKSNFAERMFFTRSNHTDHIFDAALFADVKNANAQLRHSIAEKQQKLSDLKNCFRMRMNVHSAHQFQQSIRRYRNTSFAAFC